MIIQNVLRDSMDTCVTCHASVRMVWDVIVLLVNVSVLLDLLATVVREVSSLIALAVLCRVCVALATTPAQNSFALALMRRCKWCHTYTVLYMSNLFVLFKSDGSIGIDICTTWYWYWYGYWQVLYYLPSYKKFATKCLLISSICDKE